MIWTRGRVEKFIYEGNLSSTEEDVFRMWTRKETITAISLKLNISESTVNRTIKELKKKIELLEEMHLV